METHSRFVMVGDVRTHYYDAGAGETVVLIHGGEYGGCAEISWEFNFLELARHFRVIAPDMVGYGRTDKLFDFRNFWTARLRHVQRFLELLCVDRAHFIGNSMGGGMILEVAAQDDPIWPIDKMVIANGGGSAPDNEVRALLNSYDCTKEHMRRIVETIFVNPARHDEAYVERRYRLSIEPGAWECTSAARFKSPVAERTGPKPAEYSRIGSPSLLTVGARDNLRDRGFGKTLQAMVPHSQLRMFPDAGHCPHIDCPDEFNAAAIAFLSA